VRAAWEGLEAGNVWDSHAHLIGTGDSASGIYVNPRTESLFNPGEYARRLFFLNAGCVHEEKKGSVDRAYVERMHNLADGMKPGFKLVLFAFERAFDDGGQPDLPHSMFYVPDAYTRDTAKKHARYFEWAASVHPYRADALKWLPSAMNIDPASKRCDAFYDFLSKNNMPLIVHAGEERAVTGSEKHEYGNPLRLRRALDAGVRVVVAHCASIGEDRDLDKGEAGPYVESFSLFARLMKVKSFEGRLFGDISAITQRNRAGPNLVRIVETGEWHARLLNGSDYPLPGLMPVFSVDYLVSLKLLPESAAPVLKEIRLHNPLLFDFVLKRNLRSNGKALSTSVFETRRFFVR
jgi:hypothetical protein